MKFLLPASLLLGLNHVQAMNTGTSGCPCIEWAGLDKYISGSCINFVPSEGMGSNTDDSYCYPVNYGSTECKVWDETLEPFCAGSSGNKLSNAPAWCQDAFCYVDKNNCDAIIGKSGMFPNEDLYYSYATCGADSSFDDWLNGGGTKDLKEIAEIVEDYVTSAVDTIEASYLSTAEAAQTSEVSTYCGSTPNSCSCVGCEVTDGWGCEQVDFTQSNIIFGCKYGTCVDPNSPAAIRGQCMAKDVATAYQRVANKEYRDKSRIAYQYFGEQDSGVFLQWPEAQWCNKDGVSGPAYDPRFRPWYSLASSGSKDLVIIIDVSGSMGANNRIDIARDAALALVDTLTWADYVNVILFDHDTEQYKHNELSQMTADNKKALKEWLNDNVYTRGGTDFRGGYEAAFASLDTSPTCSNCNKAILFMTDGDATWESSDLAWLQQKRAEHGCMAFFTYALGSGLSNEAKYNLKQMACQNKGMYHEIADGGNLANEMSSYYNYFASGTAVSGEHKLRWVLYPDAVTGADLFGACSAAFDYTVDPPKLIGVTCMDVNMLADIPMLKAQSSWNSFTTEIISKTTECSHVGFSENQLEELRRRNDPDTMCGTSGTDDDIFACEDFPVCPSSSIDNAFPTESQEPVDTSKCGGGEDEDGGDDEGDGGDDNGLAGQIGGGTVAGVLFGLYVVYRCCKCCKADKGKDSKAAKKSAYKSRAEPQVQMQQTQYGQQQPHYGQQQPQYGQQSMVQYSQQQPQFGGYAEPQYATATPVYNADNSKQYNNPPPAYD